MKQDIFLKENGYKKGPVPSFMHADGFYTKAYKVKEGKRYIHVAEFKREEGAPPEVPEWSYEVSSTFGTSIGTANGEAWFNGKFYMVPGEDLPVVLLIMERHLEDFFKRLGGKHD